MTNSTIATVFIVDDDAAIRESLKLLLEQSGYRVKLFESAELFLEQYQEEQLGCAIIDIRMDGMNGLQLQQQLNARKILLPVIILSGHGTIAMSVTAIKAKAIDFLTKPVSSEKLLKAVELAVMESARSLANQEKVKHIAQRFSDLTEREREVLAEAIQGNTNKTIARHLNISHRTVEIHKSKIMQKTGALNLIDLARLVHQSSQEPN